MQILKLFQWFQPITDDHTRHRDDVINDYCEYGEQGLQISHAYFCFVSAFCFTCKHAETKLKQNNFTETKHCFAFVWFQFYFRCNHCIRHVQHVLPNRGSHKKGPPQKERQIFACRKNERLPSETIVMSKKGRQFLRRTLIADTRHGR